MERSERNPPPTFSHLTPEHGAVWWARNNEPTNDMNYDDYALIHKNDLSFMRNRIKELEHSNSKLMELGDTKRMLLIHKTEDRLTAILKAGHCMADRKHCYCWNSKDSNLKMVCGYCRSLIDDWKSAVGNLTE
jgi:hypothetical protein